MTFDEIIEYENHKEKEISNMDKVRNQRQICAVIICGVIYDGLKLEQWEHSFVHKINRMMQPAPEKAIKKLEEIESRRWAKEM